MNGDGDASDTNNVVGSLPCDRSPRVDEPAYSPLWAVRAVDVLPNSVVSLIDTTGDQRVSDVRSAGEMRLAVDAGVLGEPRAETNNSVFGGVEPVDSGQLFFNCPSPVREDFVPYPCAVD